MRLENKVVVVTGGASGIGRGIASLFATEGARVALVDRDAALLASAAAEIRSSAGKCLECEGDVADSAAVEAAATRIVAEWHRIDGIVTAAGISIGKTIVETSEEGWDQVFAVNVKGTFLWLRAVVPLLIAAGGGSIVTIASQLALAGGRNSAAYVASKGAVISLTRSVALDYAGQGIRANVILPGAIATPMLERSFARHVDPETARQASRLRHPLGRFGTVNEVAQAALFLMSNASTFTTGVQLPVDGGWVVG